jgi:hypothetical protein
MANHARALLLIGAALALVAAVVPAASTQRRGEYITDDEMDLVRDIRRIDIRAQVFLKIADRRLVAIADPAAEPKDSMFRKFGALPKGSQIDLLDDYRRAVEELMVKFDDEYERTGMTDDLRKGLEFTVAEVERQMKEMDALKPKLTQEDAPHYLEKALGAARELHDGAKAALDANPAPKKN